MEGRREGNGGWKKKISHASSSSAGRPRLRAAPTGTGQPPRRARRPGRPLPRRGARRRKLQRLESFACDSTAGWGDRADPRKGGALGSQGFGASGWGIFLGSPDEGCLRGMALHPQCRSSPNRLPSDSRKLLKSPTRGMTHSRASAQNKLRHGEEWREQGCWGRAGGAGEGRGGGKRETEGGREKRRGRNNSI